MKLVPKKKKTLSGAKLAGGNPENKRVENDYYATNPKALEMLLKVFPLHKGKTLEPCVGAGHLARVLKSYGCDVDCVDLVDRGYPDTVVHDFLTYNTDVRYDNIVTNPPFSLAEEFIRKSMTLLKPHGICCMFLKIQFLESGKRKAFYNQFPPKYIYVFRDRMATWNNGQPLDPKGKRWATTMCHAWFIFEKDFQGEPIVRWL